MNDGCSKLNGRYGFELSAKLAKRCSCTGYDYRLTCRHAVSSSYSASRLVNIAEYEYSSTASRLLASRKKRSTRYSRI
ncbi:SWIM zinc finger family protein [Paenibacillus catalpae]|uniref:SWIM zinc finger family protein n=1 Tax=Paenibacillus catalpae TaxID=1045775 RepID=UPI003CCBA5C5